MFSNLIISYSKQFFLPVPAFAFCELWNLAGALAGEDGGKKVVEYLGPFPCPG